MSLSRHVYTSFGEPYEGVHLFDSMPDLVVCIQRFDAQFKDKSVDFIDNQSHRNTLVQCMSDEGFRIHHDLNAV